MRAFRASFKYLLVALNCNLMLTQLCFPRQASRFMHFYHYYWSMAVVADAVADSNTDVDVDAVFLPISSTIMQ